MFRNSFNRIRMIFKESVSLFKGGWSLSYVMWNIIWWLSWSFRFMSLNNVAAEKKAKKIEKHLLKNYSDIIEKYRQAEESTEICRDFKIWVFWGQGKDCMPAIVNACYRKMTEHNDNVQLIDMNNVCEFVKIPNTVYDKLKKGKLSYTHFSDIVRNSILSKYGGLWLDATVWTDYKIPKIASQSTFFSPHDMNSSTYWCTYAMGSNKIKSITFSFVKEILTAVCTKEHAWPEYLFQDRVIDFAYKYIPATKKAIDDTPENNTRRFMLFSLMNKPYNEQEYQELLADNFIFKLSYKANYKLICKGEKTYYAELIANKQ